MGRLGLQINSQIADVSPMLPQIKIVLYIHFHFHSIKVWGKRDYEGVIWLRHFILKTESIMEIKRMYQPIDIMDFFEYPQVARNSWGGDRFEISFPDLCMGDLDVRIGNGDEVIEYTARNSLKPTLQAVTALLPIEENCDPYFGNLRHRTRFGHRDDMDIYNFDLRTFEKKNDTSMWLQILVMKSSEENDYKSIWNCEEDFENFCTSVGGLDALREWKIFSIELEFRLFLAKLYNASRKFIFRKTFKAYMDEEKEGFPVSELTKIEKHIKYC